MKKILTLLIASGTFFTMHAQSREEARRVILGEKRDNGTYGGRNDRDVVLGRGGNNNGQYPSGNSTDRQYQIDQINREYDNKIYSIRNNPHLSNAEKERAIRQLENDRQRRINAISRRNNNDDRRYDDDDRRYDNDRYEKQNNGKHKGWNKKNKNKNWKKGQRNWD